MNSDKKRVRWRKAKIKRCMNGAISVLLCLLLTPFLSVTLALIEYGRYQQVMEIADELMELTELFALSDYDPYIHSRFGVLTISQSSTLSDDLETILVENAKITGHQLTPSNVSTVGKYSLQNNQVLKRQLMDFSQITVPTALIMEDLKLEELLNKLQGLEWFSNVTDTVDQLATATKKVKNAVEAINGLKASLSTLENAISTTKNKAIDLAGRFTDLVKDLGDRDISLPASASAEDIQAALQVFMDDGDGSGSLLDQFKDIYIDAKKLKDSLGNIKSAITTVKTKAQAVSTAVSEAKTAISEIGNRGSQKEKDISQKMTVTLQSVVDEMQELVEHTMTQLQEESVQTIKSTVDEITDIILNESGLSNVANRYSKIVNGTYVRRGEDGSLTVSDTAKQDVIDFLKMAHTVYSNAQSHSDVGGTIKAYFQDRFIPSIAFDPSDISDRIETVIVSAGDALKSSAEGEMSGLLEKLSNLAGKIFHLTLTSDHRLNAVVSLGSPDSNGAQEFVNAVDRLLDAVDDFTDSLGSFDLFGALGAVWDLMMAVKDMFVAIFHKVENIISGIAGLAGGVGAIYDRLAISGYMAHSLPCRLDAGELENGKVKLDKQNGTSLTGFSFDDIPRGDNSFKGAELEYVYQGTNDERANQELTFWDIYFLRLLIDLPTIFTDGEVSALAAAANIASWVVYLIYILAEPFLDTVLLVNDQSLPLVKGNCWLTASGIRGFTSKLVDASTECVDLKDAVNGFVDSSLSDLMGGGDDGGSGDDGGDGGLKYRDYLLIMMLITSDTDRQVQRLGNLIDMETTQYYAEKDMAFHFEKTYTALDISADMAFDPFVDMGRLAGSGPLDFTGHMTRTVSY